MSEKWPDARIEYERPRETDENTRRWQSALDEALRAGSLHWEKTTDKDLFRLAGQCPRCSHDTDMTVELNINRNFAPESGRVRLNFKCYCRQADMHGGSVEKSEGCGWGGPLAVESVIPEHLR